MPSYWIQPHADIAARLPADQRDELSEDFYGLIGAGYTMLFDAFPPVFTQVQQIAGVDIDSLLPLYISSRMTDYEDLPAEIARVAKDLATVRDRFHALREGLVRQPGWERTLELPEKGYAPKRAYFASFEKDPPKPYREPWEDDVPDDEEATFRTDMRYLLHYLDFAHAQGGTKFWLLGR